MASNKNAHFYDDLGSVYDENNPWTAPQNVAQVDAETAHNIALGGVGPNAPTPHQNWTFPNPTTDPMTGQQTNTPVPNGPAEMPYTGGQGSGGDVDQGGNPIPGGNADPSQGGTVGTTGGGGGGGAGGDGGPGVPGFDTPARGGMAQAGNFGNHFVNMQAYLNANQGGMMNGATYGNDPIKGGQAGTADLPPPPVDPAAPAAAAAPPIQTPAQGAYHPSGNYTSGMAGVDQMLSQGYSQQPRQTHTKAQAVQPVPDTDLASASQSPVGLPPHPANQFSEMNNQLGDQGGASAGAPASTTTPASVGAGPALGLGGFTAASNAGAAAGSAPNTTTPTANTPGQSAPAQSPSAPQPAAKKPLQEDMEPGTPLGQYTPPKRTTGKQSGFSEMYDSI